MSAIYLFGFLSIVAWPTTTTEGTTTVGPTTTNKPGEWTVNNITYSRINNSCYEAEAVCPVNCNHNKTFVNGTECVRCFCSMDVFKYTHPGKDFSVILLN